MKEMFCNRKHFVEETFRSRKLFVSKRHFEEETCHGRKRFVSLKKHFVGQRLVGNILRGNVL